MAGLSYWGALASCPQIIFLQEKQAEILRGLHQEIVNLKHENSELKFQLNVNMHYLTKEKNGVPSNREASKDDRVTGICELTTNYNNQNELQRRVREMEKALESERSRVTSLRTDFESLTEALNDVKRTRLQYKNLTVFQHQQIKELEKQLFETRSSEEPSSTLHHQIAKVTPKKASHCPRLSYPNEKLMQEQMIRNRQRSSSTSSSSSSKSGVSTTRRSSLFSLLPSNYKDSVATLPPISISQMSADTSLGSRFNNPNSSMNLAACRLHSNLPMTRGRAANMTGAGGTQESSHMAFKKL